VEYYSQYNQDFYIDELLKGKNNGVFIDIGAWDGVRYSNSYFFETKRNWTGVCVEPLSYEYKKLIKNRKCECFNIAISTKDGIEDFIMINHPEGGGMLSGLANKYNKAHMKRVNNFKDKIKRIKVKCKTFNNLFYDVGLFNIDYCSIDVEGPDFEILKSIDFNKFDIKTFSIENNYKDNIKDFMHSKNYTLIKKLGCDEIYLKNE